MAWGGPYTATSWVNGTTPLSQTHLNNLETQYQLATQTFEQDLITPFVLYGLVATKDGTTVNQLDVTAGVAFLLQTDSTVARQSISSSSGPLTTSAHTATYYLDLNPNGTYSFATSHSGTANYLTIAQVTTDGSGNISTVTDERTTNTELFPSSTHNIILNTVSIGSAAPSGAGIGGIFYNTGNNALVVSSARSGGVAQGIYFTSWNGSSSPVPFSVGGQFNSALSWVDNSGNIVTGAALLFGASVSASQSSLFYGTHVVSLVTPQAGGTALGFSFETWTGAAAAVPLSLGGQFNSAVTYITNAGAFAQIASQPTSGAYGMALMVAGPTYTSIASTSATDCLSFTPGTAASFRVNMTATTVPGGTISCYCVYKDAVTSASVTAYFTTQGGTSMNAASISANGYIRCQPFTIYAASGTAIQLWYRNATATPNDGVIPFIELIG